MKGILIFDHGECLGEVEYKPSPDPDGVMEVIDVTFPNGDKGHVLHIFAMDYGILIPEETATIIKEVEEQTRQEDN